MGERLGDEGEGALGAEEGVDAEEGEGEGEEGGGDEEVGGECGHRQAGSVCLWVGMVEAAL